MYSQDEQLHVASWPSFSLYEGMAHALGAEVNMAASRTYAVEGGCYVIASVATVSQAMLDELGAGGEREALLRRGGGHAMVFGPDGRSLAEPLAPDAEGLVVAEVDLGAIALAKSVTDPAGHYARADVTRLVLDPTRRRPVELVGAAAPPPDEPAFAAGEDGAVELQRAGV
jgi:aliphatic nitrilase